MREPEFFDAPVPGGSLHVARWPGKPGSPVVIAAHGITANHRNFSVLADLLDDELTLVAPDLRGRGRSSSLPGPFGMRQHATDLVSVLDHLEVERAVFLGHSMGGFVVPVAGVLYADRVASLVVVDGGIKVFDPPPGADIEEILGRVLGPSLERLKMTFPTRQAYFQFWRAHPGLKDVSDDLLSEYVFYDLVGEEGAYRSCVSLDAVIQGSSDTLTDIDITGCIEQVTMPMTFLWATRGLFDETPGLYSDKKVAELHAKVPQLDAEKVDANHWTILFGSGASVVAERLRKAIRA